MLTNKMIINLNMLNTIFIKSPSAHFISPQKVNKYFSNQLHKIANNSSNISICITPEFNYKIKLKNKKN